MDAPSFRRWRKSSRSDTNGDCVEISPAEDAPVYGVRDSKMPEAGQFVLDPTNLKAFVRSAAHR